MSEMNCKIYSMWRISSGEYVSQLLCGQGIWQSIDLLRYAECVLVPCTLTEVFVLKGTEYLLPCIQCYKKDGNGFSFVLSNML